MKKNIIGIFPDPNDATSFYRGMSVMGQMRKINSETFEYTPLHVGIKVTWALLQQGDILFLQRPFTPEHALMAEMAKANGLKLWVDWDDDLLNIPFSNYTHAIYASRKARENVKRCLDMADLCTVSTKHLRFILGDRPNTHVIPNALNTTLFRLQKRIAPKKKRTIFWRGGKTHIEDLMEYGESIENVVVKHGENVDWIFCGEPEWPIIQRLSKYKQVQFVEAKDVIAYHSAYNHLQPDIAIVPLKNCPFNESKSMCAWLEATYGGAACLGPDFEEWQREGITNYKDPKEFEEKLNHMIENVEFCIELQNKSVDTILDGLTLNDTAEERLRLLSQLY